MPHAHDLPFPGARAHFEFVRHALGSGDERVVAPHLAWIRQSREQRAPVVLDLRGLAVHEATGTHHLAAEDLDDRLVSQAHPQDRDAAGEGPDHLHRHAGIVGRAWSRGDAQVRRREVQRLRGAECIVAMYDDFRAQHQEGLHQVVGEGVVVVDQQQLRLHSPSCASSRARAIAPLLASTSSCSLCGTLSATMPAPAW